MVVVAVQGRVLLDSIMEVPVMETVIVAVVVLPVLGGVEAVAEVLVAVGKLLVVLAVGVAALEQQMILQVRPQNMPVVVVVVVTPHLSVAVPQVAEEVLVDMPPTVMPLHLIQAEEVVALDKQMETAVLAAQA
jgi:hypothetical protein